ncbi:unnamed protein product, partial [Adineta steineri]
ERLLNRDELQDRTYFLHIIRAKISEVKLEIQRLQHEIESLTENRRQYIILNKTAEDLSEKVKDLQNDLEDYNMARMNSFCDVTKVKKEIQDLNAHNQQVESCIEQMYLEKQRKEEQIQRLEHELTNDKQKLDTCRTNLDYNQIKTTSDQLQYERNSMENEISILDNRMNKMREQMLSTVTQQEAFSLIEQISELEIKHYQLINDNQNFSITEEACEKLTNQSDVDKAIESVQEYYTTIETNLDSVIEQIQSTLSNPTDDKFIKTSIQNTLKPLAKQYSDKHKDLHGSISKIGKTIDKSFQSDFGNVPITELFDTPEKFKLIYMIICEDLYRQGRMSIADKLIEESKLNDNDLFNLEKNFLEEINMILENLREKNLLPAIDWCVRHRNELNKTNSLLEFYLHKMRFVQLLQLGNFNEAKTYLTNLRQYSIMNGQCEQDVNQLMGALVFAQRDLSKSPYKYLLEPHLWLQLSELFMQQAFQQVGLAQDSPLYVVMKIGFQALPALMSIVNAMQNTQVCHILSKDELPIEIDVGQEHRYHSVFACPILRQQTTDQNPPMKLVCGHVISKDALNKLSIQNKLKCPYCPLEQSPSDARQLFF